MEPTGPFRLEDGKSSQSTEELSIYQPKGKLSLETVTDFIKVLRADPAKHLIIDMSGITYLDSAGVGSLVSLFVNRRSNAKTFALAGLSSQSSAVVTVAGLHNLLPIYKTLDEALAKKP